METWLGTLCTEADGFRLGFRLGIRKPRPKAAGQAHDGLGWAGLGFGSKPGRVHHYKEAVTMFAKAFTQTFKETHAL